MDFKKFLFRISDVIEDFCWNLKLKRRTYYVYRSDKTGFDWKARHRLTDEPQPGILMHRYEADPRTGITYRLDETTSRNPTYYTTKQFKFIGVDHE